MSLRWVLGPAFASMVTRPAAPPALPAPDVPATPPKADPIVELLSVDAVAWTAKLGLPAYDPATSNVLAESRIYLVPAGSDRPADGPAFEASAYPFVSTGDLSAVLTGGEAAVDLPDVPAGDYFGQVVNGFAT